MADDSGTIVASGTSANIPSGSGSERLRRVTVHQLNNGWQNNVISGTAGHLYTILSITFTDQQGADGNCAIRMNNGSTDIYLLHSQSVGSLDTFVWNDRFVLEEDDDLDVYNSCTNGDWFISYIDQDWT
tara:strand:- start:2672 stop:3058 length:387 start_codon:yes stop_codon:yes gene_type:complete